jgi:hypothetical protein
MLEVEGGEHEWCMRILRHEAGHAIDNAYKLRRGASAGAVRRSSSVSRVLHAQAVQQELRHAPRPWYAQSHPDEDFAETFAVWLTPESTGPALRGWPALKKLDTWIELMRSVRARPPLGRNRGSRPAARLGARCAALPSAARTTASTPGFYDRDLRRLFSDAPETRRPSTAAQFLAASASGAPMVAELDRHLPVHDRQVLEDMIARCRELKLRLAVPEDRRARSSPCC